ncbi:MAG TPA: P-type conjugative transfer protein TrbL [Stellaceae bacterium]|nr:P-type conjugative transfer protein TrbL [Stellaceae bacterium]
MTHTRLAVLAATAAVLVLATAGPAFANVPQGNVLDTITTQFQTATQSWQSGLYNVALDLFAALALIEFALAMILLAVQKPDFSEILAELVRQMLTIGLFFWLLQNSQTLAQDIVSSLRQAATAAGAPAITPSAIFAAGINIASLAWQQLSATWNPATLVALMICDLVIVVAFVLCAVWTVAALCEAYFVIGAASLLLAFGGNRFSREIAISLLKYCFAAGIKLFAIAMIVGTGNQMLQQWTAGAAQITVQGMFTIVGCAIALGALSKVVPDLMQRIITGSPISMAHHRHVAEAVAAAATVAAAPVIGLAGSGALATTAARYGVEQLARRDEEGTAPSGRAHRAVAAVGYAAGGVARAGLTNLGNRLGGRIGGRGAAMRMAMDLSHQRRVIQAERKRPNPSGSKPQGD